MPDAFLINNLRNEVYAATKYYDVDGKEIFEGDTLTFDWFDGYKHLISCIPDEEKRNIYMHLPCFIVKRNGAGRLFGEGLEGDLYLHDFSFKGTKKL